MAVLGIGKTERDLETRVKEHFENIKNGEIEKSVVAAHGKKNMQLTINQTYYSKHQTNKN